MKRNKIYKISLHAVFIALVIMSSILPIGFITLGPISFTTLHVLVIIAGFTLGIEGGVVTGLTFGLSSWILAFSSASLNYVFINPLISVIPRLILGGLAGLCGEILRYKIKGKKGYFIIGGLFAGLLTLIHTFLVVSAMYLFAGNLMTESLVKLLMTTVLILCLFETILAIFVSPSVSYVLNKNFVRRKK